MGESAWSTDRNITCLEVSGFRCRVSGSTPLRLVRVAPMAFIAILRLITSGAQVLGVPESI